MKKVDAKSHLEIICKCPHCKFYMDALCECPDISEQFDEGDGPRARNCNVEVRCPECKMEFIIENINF